MSTTLENGHNKFVSCRECPHEAKDCQFSCEGFKARVKYNKELLKAYEIGVFYGEMDSLLKERKDR